MPEIILNCAVALPMHQVWQKLTALDEFAANLSDIERLVILESGNDWAVSEWTVKLEDSRLWWVERDVYFPAANRIEFTQIDGDLKQFQGHWQLSATDNGQSLLRLSLAFDIGMPMLADMLHPIADRAIRDFFGSFITSLAV